MGQASRTKNSIRNIFTSIGMQVLIFLLSFISRTIFIKILGEEYLGINGLYTSILSVLSLADLGLYTVMIYSLYKPLASGDQEELIKLINYYKKLYRIIAFSILILGMIFLPFLHYFIKDSGLALSKLRLYFLIYLINTCCSYLIVYKSTIITADQKIYITKIVDFVMSFLLHAIQIGLLLLTHNFLLYLSVNILITLIKNFTLSIITDKKYPFLKRSSTKDIDQSIKKSLWKNLKAIFLYRVSAMIMNSTDNLLISIILGVGIVGYYSNYLLIVSAVNSFIALLASSILASLGNFNTKESSQRKWDLFKILLLMFFGIATFCSCCFLSVFNDFIKLWLGKIDTAYILSTGTVIAITFNFFVTCIINPIWLYRETTGLFVETKYSMMMAAVCNIILSIILGRLFGLAGIIAATALSQLLTNVWFEPLVLCKKVFQIKIKEYWLYFSKLILISLPCMVIMFYFGKVCSGSFIFIALKIIISALLTGLVYFLTNIKSKELQYILSKLKKILRKKKKVY